MKKTLTFDDSIAGSLNDKRSIATTSLDVTGKSISEARMPMTIKENMQAQEISKKEDACRERFEDNIAFYTRKRNPVLCEMTPREGATDVELLVPFKHSMKLNMNTLKMEQTKDGNSYNQTSASQRPFGKTSTKDLSYSDYVKVNNMSKSSRQLGDELAEMKKVIAYKQAQLKKTNISAVSASAVLFTGGVSVPTVRASRLKIHEDED